MHCSLDAVNFNDVLDEITMTRMVSRLSLSSVANTYGQISTLSGLERVVFDAFINVQCKKDKYMHLSYRHADVNATTLHSLIRNFTNAPYVAITHRDHRHLLFRNVHFDWSYLNNALPGRPISYNKNGLVPLPGSNGVMIEYITQ